MFVATYSLATFGADLRTLASMIPHHSSDLGTRVLSRRSEKQVKDLAYPAKATVSLILPKPIGD
jgi:hypothetical protein